MHGHNWKVEVEVSGNKLDNIGMVIDFKKIRIMTNQVVDRLDHQFLNDLSAFKDENPTAENIAKYIHAELTKSINNDNEWFYIERTLTKGEYHKLGRNILKSNNILVLNFNKYGILKNMVFLDKENKNKIKFSERSTENELSQRSFVERFLSSIKEKMYSNR